MAGVSRLLVLRTGNRWVGHSMALTLEKYAELLDKRGEPRPAGPTPVPFANAKPALPKLAGIKAVILGGYGTSVLIQGEQLHFINPDPVMRRISLEKTIQEFKMWASMSRKPGEPSEYMTTILNQVMDKFIGVGATIKHFEMRIDKVWEGVLHRLFQRDYIYDTAMYGDEQAYTQKISYFYLRASQGVSIYPNMLSTLQSLHDRGILLGIHANGQCVTPVQIGRELAGQGKFERWDQLFTPALCKWSYEMGVKKESDVSFSQFAVGLAEHGLKPTDCLVLSGDIETDLVPAKKRGYRTAVLLADKQSAKVKPEQLKDEKSKPVALLTEFSQLTALFPGK